MWLKEVPNAGTVGTKERDQILLEILLLLCQGPRKSPGERGNQSLIPEIILDLDSNVSNTRNKGDRKLENSRDHKAESMEDGGDPRSRALWISGAAPATLEAGGTGVVSPMLIFNATHLNTKVLSSWTSPIFAG